MCHAVSSEVLPLRNPAKSLLQTTTASLTLSMNYLYASFFVNMECSGTSMRYLRKELAVRVAGALRGICSPRAQFAARKLVALPQN
jgi:hypothetical protein